MCSEPPQLHTSMGMHVGTGTRCRGAETQVTHVGHDM